MDKLIPHSKPFLGEEEAKAVSDIVRSGYIAQGPEVKAFEEELAEYLGVKGAVAVNSGTSAMHLGLRAIGIGEGDNVILPSYVCTAPMNAVYQAGAEPKLADIDNESMNIAPDEINAKMNMTDKAVIVPHMFGNVADLERIGTSGMDMVEDLAHSVGAFYGDSRAGGFGRFSILSFYANKMMACGEGGAVVSDDEELLSSVRDTREYDHAESYRVRYNYKMTDIQAAVGRVQLKRLDEMIELRRAAAARYNDLLGDAGLILPEGEFDHVYYRYVVRLPEGFDIDAVISSMRDQGVVAARPVYRPIHRYMELRSGFRNTDRVYSSAVSIPIYPSITSKEQEQVAESLEQAISCKL